MLSKDETLLLAQEWCVLNRQIKPAIGLLSSLWKYLTLLTKDELKGSTLSNLTTNFVDTIIQVNGRLGDLLFTCNGAKSWNDVLCLFEALESQQILKISSKDLMIAKTKLDTDLPFKEYILQKAECQKKEIK